VQHLKTDFFDGEVIGGTLFVGMVGEAEAISLYCFDNVTDIHALCRRVSQYTLGGTKTAQLEGGSLLSQEADRDRPPA